MASAEIVEPPKRNKTARYYVKSAVQQAMSRVIRSTGLYNKKPRPGAYIDIGSGKNCHGEFFSIDYYWVPGLDMVHDITKGFPFRSETVGGIFTEHCLEHIEFDQFIDVVREFQRILIPGGIARIVVPDGKLYLDLYQKAQSGKEIIMPSREEDDGYPFYTPMMSVNRIMRSHGHRFIYDFRTMREILLHVGFAEVNQRQFRVGEDPVLLVDQEFRRPESLYVEAKK